MIVVEDDATKTSRKYWKTGEDGEDIIVSIGCISCIINVIIWLVLLLICNNMMIINIIIINMRTIIVMSITSN